MTIDLDYIFNAIARYQNQSPSRYITLASDDAIGAIPKDHLDIYLSSGLFQQTENRLHFAPTIKGFDAKTHAMETVTDALIDAGKIDRTNVPHFQQRAVGDHDRLSNPEFAVNRAYHKYFGFAADAVFVNIAMKENDQLLLQRRSDNVVFPNTLDFAAGGAVKFPETIEESLAAQSKSEIGVSPTEATYQGTSELCWQAPDQGFTTRLSKRLFWHTLSKHDLRKAQFDTEEVIGYELVRPEEAVELCATAEFATPNTQSFLTSLMLADRLPDFKGVEDLKALLSSYISHQPHTDGTAPQKPKTTRKHARSLRR
jgi:hypothetical protein